MTGHGLNNVKENSNEIMSNPTTAIVKSNGDKLRGLLTGDQFKTAILQVLPKHLKPDRFVRVALMAMTKNPLLCECDQASFFQALLTLSQLGLEPDGRRAHLIPFKNHKKGIHEVQLVVDYKGLAELITNTGLVSNIHADVVCENDDFEYDIGEVKRHKINWREPRGEVYAVYAVIRFKDGSVKADCMSVDDVEAIRRRSRAANGGPWVTDWNEMAKKTVFRRCSKLVKLSPEEREAVEADDNQFEEHRLNAAKGVFGSDKSLPLFTMPPAAAIETGEVTTEVHPEPEPAEEPVKVAEPKKAKNSPLANPKTILGDWMLRNKVEWPALQEILKWDPKKFPFADSTASFEELTVEQCAVIFEHRAMLETKLDEVPMV